MNIEAKEYETGIKKTIAGGAQTYVDGINSVKSDVISKYEEVQNRMTSMADYFTWPWEKYTDKLADIGNKPADYYLTFQEIVEKNGFGFEEHQVTTDDGYVLHVQRIMNKEVQAGE